MNIKKMKMLLTISDFKTLTRAAEETGYTQSGVSNIIKSLEDDLGFPLLHRLHRGVALTEEAETMIPVIRELDNLSEQLSQIISGIRGLETGTVRVASVVSFSISWLPRILKYFQAHYPKISIKLYVGGDQEILKWLEEGRMDLALCCEQPVMEYDWLPLVHDELVAVLPEDHPMAGLEEFPLAAFNKMPFVMMQEEYHNETTRIFERFGIVPDVQFTATDDHTTIAMVEQGLGASMLSRIILSANTQRRVKFLALNPRCPRVLGIALRPHLRRSRATEKFIEVAKSIVNA